jgi:DNA repair protein RadD
MKMYKLRPYQQDSVDAVVKYFRIHETPAVIVLPTGAGKSLVIAEIAKIARGRVLVLAHVKELVEQNHAKFEAYELNAGIYSAGLARKDFDHKVIFGSIQSVARAEDEFFNDFSIVVIDECHRVSMESSSQYAQVISKLQKGNEQLKVLGLTATPYRLGIGWIYNNHYKGMYRTKEDRFFKDCIFELPLSFMINKKYLTPPVLIDSPVACYDFSSIIPKNETGQFKQSDIDAVLKDQKRVTPGIIGNILEMSKDRLGVMIFTSSVKHANEILGHLPKDISTLVVGETELTIRDQIINDFKDKKIKYLVNVSVLTTGFDAPHVDLIAILRPTESVSLYQQIIGRGLRLSPGKEDCLILDYTGVGHNLFSPEVGEKKPSTATEQVEVDCPLCGYKNLFWGIKEADGFVSEHFGRNCFAIDCGFRFRFKSCPDCGAENDISARVCNSCDQTLVDPDKKLKEAMQLKDAHIMRPDSMTYEKSLDKKGSERLEIKFYDLDGEHLTEYFYLESISHKKAFFHNFIRHHIKNPGPKFDVQSIDQIILCQKLFRIPQYIIARKEKYYWRIREKIF